MLHSSHVVNT